MSAMYGLAPGTRVTLGPRGKRPGTVSEIPTGAGGYVYVVWDHDDETLCLAHVRDLVPVEGG